ncbi:hypothetical protein cgR_5031 [Corynebacterium glutamicum R]|uniref:Uncharacterized protein n=1 Tax=Corynebacterium glutamicum (strain R) TaxID=340322 RepID=A0AB72VBD2_CORGB|nr:hypothetical protein cgR_5031 [Corynebacterium glutamicum R]
MGIDYSSAVDARRAFLGGDLFPHGSAGGRNWWGRYQVGSRFGDSRSSLGNAGSHGGNCGIIVNFCLTGWNFCGC